MSQPQRLVESPGRPGVGIESPALDLGELLRDHGSGTVSAAVVDDEDVVGRTGLLRDSAETFSQELLPVVGDNDGGDRARTPRCGRRGGCVCLSPGPAGRHAGCSDGADSAPAEPESLSLSRLAAFSPLSTAWSLQR